MINFRKMANDPPRSLLSRKNIEEMSMAELILLINQDRFEEKVTVDAFEYISSVFLGTEGNPCKEIDVRGLETYEY